MKRIVAMPADVTETDSNASFKNGVLEVRLRKAKILPRARIQIE
jgi:HSP20 family molecular chaperone IbpA